MSRTITIGAIVLAIVVGLGLYLTVGTATSPTAPVETASSAEAGEVDTSGIIEMVIGEEDAPITVVEYASFTCPHCASFHDAVFKPLKSDYIDAGKVKFIYRDVFFDAYGLWASMVARCGGETRFFGISDMLYSQQKEWLAGDDRAIIAENLRKIGKVAGLTQENLDVCLNDDANAKALVAWFQQNAEVDDISSTPTLVIDGEKHSNMSYAELKAILDAKLGQ